jgi:hypothetical protein
MMTKLMESIFKGGVMAALFAAAMPDIALAAVTTATDLKGSVSQLGEGMTNMPIVLSGIAYLAAGATMIHGCGLLKKHADNPTSQPLMAGVSRLMAGGVVASLPFGLNWAINSFNWGGSSTENAPYIALPMNSGNFNIPGIGGGP